MSAEDDAVQFDGAVPESDAMPAGGYADLAETVMLVARELRMREQRSFHGVMLKPWHAHVMRHVDAHAGVVPSELAEATGLLRTNVSAALRELETIGFIERRGDPNDGRTVHLYPTPLAQQNFANVRTTWSDAVSEVLAHTGGVAEATDLLTRLATGLASDRRESGTRSPAAAM